MKLSCSALAILIGLAGTPAMAQFSVGISVDVAPPELPVYDQPPMPDAGYLWTPGYWAYSPDGYYWVPGTWVQPPTAGVLWTPAWWGWDDGHYRFHDGYWGPHVGFYGGVNYGFGYGGDGYGGGRWEGDHFAYNHSVNNFGSVHVTNVYNERVEVNNNTHVSFNGGAGGVHAQPTQADRIAERDHHVEPTHLQAEHIQAAAGNKDLRASENHGHPAIAAVAHPAQFSGPGVSAAHGAQAPAERPGEQRPGGNERPAEQHPAAAEQHPAAPPARNQAPHPTPQAQPREAQPAHPEGAPVPQHPAPAAVPHPAQPAPHPQPAPQAPPAHPPEREKEEKKPEPHGH